MSRIDDDPTIAADEPAADEPAADGVVDEPIDDTRLDHEALDDTDARADELASDPDDGAGEAFGEPVDERPRSRSELRREWVTSERARRYAARRSVRFPIFTRSIVLWVLIFALFGVAFGASGAFWWAHFNTEVNELRDETKDFEQRAQNALSSIDAQRNEALRQIQESIRPVAGVLAQANMVKLAERFAPSVWTVTTRDPEGRDTLGSAFSIITNDDESILVTSYALVQAAATTPGPGISIRKASEVVPAELWAVDPGRDLAVLHAGRGNIPVLEWATDEAQREALGTSVFAISGNGGAGAQVSPGLVIDVSAIGLRHQAKLDFDFRGGPIVTPEGKVIGVASLSYNPLNAPSTGEMHYAPLVTFTCIDAVLCGGGLRERKDKGSGLPGIVPDDSDVQTVTGEAPGA